MWAKTRQHARIAAAALLLTAVSACEQDFEGTGRGRFQNPQDLAFVNGYVFVISSSTDELKVLDTNTYPFDWVKAPNPLQPLSIPLSIKSPVRLVPDVDFIRGSQKVTGNDVLDLDVEVRGPYVYAFNPAGTQISVIGAPSLLKRYETDTPRQLLHPELHFREVATIDAPGSVTALVSQGPGCIRQGDQDTMCSEVAPGSTENLPQSTLYFAAFSGGGSQLFRVTVPVVSPDDAFTVPVPSAPELVMDLPGEVVSSLAIVEDAIFDENLDVVRLAVAVRGSQGSTGRTFLYDFANGTELPLQFPGPVRQLVTSPGTLGGEQSSAGLRVFGLLDEAACATAAGECRGILAVDVNTGLIAEEAGGRGVMLPIRHGSANAVTFSLFRDARVRRWLNGRTLAASTAPFELLGVVAYATGTLGFFDAGALRGIDGDPNVPSMLPQEYRDPAGALLPDPCPFPNAPGGCPFGVFESGASFSEGATVSEEIFVGYRTVSVPNTALDAAQPVPTTFPVAAELLALCADAVDATHAEQCPRVRPGDTVVLTGGCTAELNVLTVGADSITTEAPPEGCAGATGFSVRAGLDRPLVIQGSATGFMGRAPAGVPFRYFRPHFFRPAEPAGDLEPDPAITRMGGYSPTDPALQFTVNPNPDIEVGASYRFFVEDGVEPQFVVLPRSNLAGSRTLYTYPSGLAYIYTSVRPDLGRTPIDTLMVSLPASAILQEIIVGEIFPNAESRGAAVFYD